MANPFENIPTVFLTQAQYETLVAGTGTVEVTDLKGNKIILGPGLNNLKNYNLLYICWRDDIKGPTGATGPRGAIGEKGATGPTGPTGKTGDPGRTVFSLTSGYDLNNATANNGVYVSSSTSICNSLLNKPTSGFIAGEIRVESYWCGTSATYLTQVLYCRNGTTHAEFSRTKSNGSWSSWFKYGEKGNTGPTGATGPQGKIGPTGVQGVIGPVGPTGPKGAQGPGGSAGPAGAAAGFGTPTASVDAGDGIPSVTVSATGANTAKVFNFAFKNLKGPKGDTGATGSVAGTTPTGSGNVVTDVSLDQSTKKLTITKNKTLATVATSGSYNDLNNKPNLDAKADNHRHYKSGDSGRDNGVYTYYKLASFPIDNAGNSCSLTVDGRIGGWNKGNKGYLSMLISNRDGIAASGTLIGNAQLQDLCDLVVYTSGATSTNSTATLYVKTHSWFAFDLTLGAMSGAEDVYDGNGSKTTPAGTLAWSLSANIGKFLRVRDNGDLWAGGAVDISGNLTVGGSALLKSGKQTTTSTADGGSNVYTFTDTKGATSTFTVKNGSKGSTGAHISSVTGDKTPAAGNTVTYTMKNTDGTTAGTFKVVNGTNGSNGSNGAAAGFGTPTASVDANVGTPSVTVTASGANTAKVFNFAFKNLKGQKGDTGSVASITNSGSGNAVTDVSLNTSTKVLTVTKNETFATKSSLSNTNSNVTTLQGYFNSGIAKKATADKNGNDITTEYVHTRVDGGTSSDQIFSQIKHMTDDSSASVFISADDMRTWYGGNVWVTTGSVQLYYGDGTQDGCRFELTNTGATLEFNDSGTKYSIITTENTATANNVGVIKAAAVRTTAITTTQGGTTDGRFYGVELDKNGKAFVNVPWTDKNTTYSAGTGLSLSGTTFSANTSLGLINSSSANVFDIYRLNSSSYRLKIIRGSHTFTFSSATGFPGGSITFPSGASMPSSNYHVIAWSSAQGNVDVYQIKTFSKATTGFQIITRSYSSTTSFSVEYLAICTV